MTTVRDFLAHPIGVERLALVVQAGCGASTLWEHSHR